MTITLLIAHLRTSQAVLHYLVAERTDVDLPVRNYRRRVLGEVPHVVGGIVIAVKELLQLAAENNFGGVVGDESSMHDVRVRIPLRRIHAPDHAGLRGRAVGRHYETSSRHAAGRVHGAGCELRALRTKGLVLEPINFIASGGASWDD